MAAKKKTVVKKKKAASKPAKKGSATDPLREAVVKARDDDAVLQVWSDALIERGDPRGELIRLQLAARDIAARPGSEAAALEKHNKLIASHIRKHVRALLGSLASVLMVNDHIVFDRGLLSECAIATDSRAKILAVVDHPDWITVRSIFFNNFTGGSLTPHLELGKKNKAHPALALLLHENLAGCESLINIGIGDVLLGLCASERPLRALKKLLLCDYDSTDETPQDIRTQIIESDALPNVHYVGIEAPPPAWLLDAKWFKNVETLEIEILPEFAVEGIAMIEANAPQITRMIFHPSCDPTFTTFSKEKGKRFTKAHVTNLDVSTAEAKKESIAFLETLPKHMTVTTDPVIE